MKKRKVFKRSRSQPTGEERYVRQRDLPHWQMGGRVYFVTLRSEREQLPDSAREQVVESILYDHRRKYHLYCAVVMPDHVHLLIRPLEEKPNVWYSLSTILESLREASTRQINQLLKTSGTVWQEESSDKIIRDRQEFLEKWDYIHNDAVSKGLVEKADDYPYLISLFDPEQE